MKIKVFIISVIITVLAFPLLAQAGWREVTFELCSYVKKPPGDGRAEDVKTFQIPQGYEYVGHHCEETTKNGIHNGYECDPSPDHRSVRLKTWADRHQETNHILVWFGPTCWLGIKAKIKCRIWEDELHVETKLVEGGFNFEFCLAPNRDLYAIKRSQSYGRHNTEVHVLSADSNYQQFSKQVITGLYENGFKFEFCLAPNLDLFAIKRSQLSGNHNTEVHVLSAASNYKQFSKHLITCLHEEECKFEFCLASNRDLYAIKKSGTDTHPTEVYVLSASSDYKKLSMQKSMPLHKTGEDFEFCLAPDKDLFAIKRSQLSGRPNTEVHTFLLEFPEGSPAAERERKRKEEEVIARKSREAAEAQAKKAQEAREAEDQRVREEVARERERQRAAHAEEAEVRERTLRQGIDIRNEFITNLCNFLRMPVPPEFQCRNPEQGQGGGAAPANPHPNRDTGL